MKDNKKRGWKKEAWRILVLEVLFLGIFFGVIISARAEEETQKEPLFDIQVTIPSQYQKIFAGEELLASIRLVNLAGPGRVDVYLDYWIKDSEENIILKKKETVAVETQASFVRTFKVPETGAPGVYHFFVKLIYGEDKEASASQTFVVEEKDTGKQEGYRNAGILLIVLVIALYLLFKSKNFWKKLAIRIKAGKIVRKRKKEWGKEKA